MAHLTSLGSVLFPLCGCCYFIRDRVVIYLCHGHDTTGVEGMFPTRGDLIFQCLSAKMVKYSSSIDGVEENGRGPQWTIRNLEWRTQRERVPAKR